VGRRGLHKYDTNENVHVLEWRNNKRKSVQYNIVLIFLDFASLRNAYNDMNECFSFANGSEKVRGHTQVECVPIHSVFIQSVISYFFVNISFTWNFLYKQTADRPIKKKWNKSRNCCLIIIETDVYGCRNIQSWQSEWRKLGCPMTIFFKQEIKKQRGAKLQNNNKKINKYISPLWLLFFSSYSCDNWIHRAKITNELVVVLALEGGSISGEIIFLFRFFFFQFFYHPSMMKWKLKIIIIKKKKNKILI
jgi:hypothetical protein